MQVLLLRQVLRVTQRSHTARDDGNLEQRVRKLQEPTRNRVSSLVVCDNLLLLGAQNAGLLLETRDDALNGLLKVLLLDSLGHATRGNQRGFVADIVDVGAGKAGSQRRELLGKTVQIQLGLDGL